MEATSGCNNATGVLNGDPSPTEANQVEATPGSTVQQPIIAKKKSKETEPKYVVWQFFKRVQDKNGVVVKSKCFTVLLLFMLI